MRRSIKPILRIRTGTRGVRRLRMGARRLRLGRGGRGCKAPRRRNSRTISGGRNAADAPASPAGRRRAWGIGSSCTQWATSDCTPRAARSGPANCAGALPPRPYATMRAEGRKSGTTKSRPSRRPTSRGDGDCPSPHLAGHGLLLIATPREPRHPLIAEPRWTTAPARRPRATPAHEPPSVSNRPRKAIWRSRHSYPIFGRFKGAFPFQWLERISASAMAPSSVEARGGRS